MLQKDGKCDVVFCGVRRVGSMGSSPGRCSSVGEISKLWEAWGNTATSDGSK